MSGSTSEHANRAWRTKNARRTPTMRWASFVRLPRNPDDCWVWMGVRGNQGYGRLSVKHRFVLAHRFAWEMFHGPVPKGMCVLHRCDVRECVNPSHLFIGTGSDNVRDMISKGRSSHMNRTHCPKGHEYAPENTYRDPQGHRACRTCRRAGKRAWNLAHRKAP